MTVRPTAGTPAASSRSMTCFDSADFVASFTASRLVAVLMARSFSSTSRAMRPVGSSSLKLAR